MLDQSVLNKARKAWRSKNYDSARHCYQEVSYSYNNFTELEKQAFTKEVAEFAKTDPIYHQILELVKQQIKFENTPVLQSKLTNVVKLDYGERGAELLRYVLYYADYNDDIIRTKKGRSYLLQLPKQQIDADIVEPLHTEVEASASTLQKPALVHEPEKKTPSNPKVTNKQEGKTSWQKIKDEFNRPMTLKDKITTIVFWTIIFFIIFYFWD